MALVLRHATGAQLAAEFRRRYREATGIEAGRLARWLLNRIADGTWTDAQVRAAFGLTVTQYNALKTRLTTRATRYDAVMQDVGE
ncbi:MAG: hypothetical protein IPM16_19130 [Chloroflexi bacterium]|nr:hypothetical protein [Chloroflexota bacterium]